MSSTMAAVGPSPSAIDLKYSSLRSLTTSTGSFEGLSPEIFAVRARPTIAGSPGLECCIVPRVKRSKPRLPCATSIALQTVGVSTDRNNLSKSSWINTLGKFYVLYLEIELDARLTMETAKVILIFSILKNHNLHLPAKPVQHINDRNLVAYLEEHSRTPILTGEAELRFQAPKVQLLYP